MSFDDFDHATLEGFTMHQDGYVLDVKCVDYGNSYVALKIKVKSRTCDKEIKFHLDITEEWGRIYFLHCVSILFM